MYQIEWGTDYEVKLSYPFQVARLLMITVLLNFFVCWLLSKLDLVSGLQTEGVLLLHGGISILACIFMLKYEIKSESLLVIPSIGINLICVNKLGQVQTEFFPRKLVKDVVIVEAIVMQKLANYLVILYHDSSSTDMKIKPIFLKSKLKIGELKSIYQKVLRHLTFTSQDKKS